MEENTVLTEQKKSFSVMDPKVLALAALVCLVLATVGTMLTDFLEGFIYDYSKNTKTDLFIGTKDWFLGGLLLPVSLFLLGTIDKKSLLPKIFLGVSALFLMVQLATSGILSLYVLTEGEYTSFIRLCYEISGSTLLSPIAAILRNLFNGNIHIYFLNFRQFLSLICCFLCCAYSLFFILNNLVCALGFVKLSFSKKQ